MNTPKHGSRQLSHKSYHSFGSSKIFFNADDSNNHADQDLYTADIINGTINRNNNDHDQRINYNRNHIVRSCNDPQVEKVPVGHLLSPTKENESLLSTTSSPPPGNLSPLRAVFMISNAALGAGLLNFPEAYMKAGGIRVAISMQFMILIFILGSFVILTTCAEQHQATTYQDIVHQILGVRAKHFVQACILIYFFGTCITYVIIIGEQLSSVLQFATGVSGVSGASGESRSSGLSGVSGESGEWYTNQKVLMVVYSVIVLFPLCVQRILKVLSYTSCFGGIGAFLIAAIIVRNFSVAAYRPHPKNEMIKSDWTSAFGALPCLCFGFQCHVSSVVVYSELKNRSRMKFFACAVCAMLICATAYSLCGGYGYSTFGAKTHPDILTNYDYNDILVSVARVCVLLILLTTFSIIVFCARNIIMDISWSLWKPGSELVRRVTITMTWFLCVLSVALIFPNISVGIGIVSGIAALFMFVVPGLCLMGSVNMDQESLSLKDLILVSVSIVYVMLGCFIFGMVTVTAVQQAATQVIHL